MSNRTTTPKKSGRKRDVVEAKPPESTLAVREEPEKSLETPWNLAKLKWAERLLKRGFSPEQVGSQLRLSLAQIEELKVDVESEPIPQTETFDQWRKRKNEEVERKVVGIAERHLDGVEQLVADGSGFLGPETMGTVKDASAIAYLWLRKGDDSAKARISIDFTRLANANPASLGPLVDLPSESVVEGDAK